MPCAKISPVFPPSLLFGVHKVVLYSLTIRAQQHSLIRLWKEEPLCTQKRPRLEPSDGG